MNDNLNQIMASGYPQGSGSSVKYVFTCHACGAQIITQNTYSTGTPGALGNALSSQAQYGLTSLLYRIPVLGSILASVISQKLNERQYQGQEARAGEAKQNAFEEIRGQFTQCTRCGTMACSSCFSNSLCKTCRQAEQVQGQFANRQNGGAGGQQGGGQGGPADPTKMWENK